MNSEKRLDEANPANGGPTAPVLPLLSVNEIFSLAKTAIDCAGNILMEMLESPQTADMERASEFEDQCDEAMTMLQMVQAFLSDRLDLCWDDEEEDEADEVDTDDEEFDEATAESTASGDDRSLDLMADGTLARFGRHRQCPFSELSQANPEKRFTCFTKTFLKN